MVYYRVNLNNDILKTLLNLPDNAAFIYVYHILFAFILV